MKKTLLILLCAVLLLNAKGQAYQKRNSSITLGYGFFNLWKSFLDKVVEIPEYKTSAIGPLTLVYEYGITNHISTGLLTSYSRVRGKAERFQLSDQITFWTVHLRADYHIWTKEKFDTYLGGGIGFNNSKYENLDPHTVGNYNESVPNTLDFSGQLGLKYFPTKHIGIYMEAGYVSGAVLHLGIAGKF